MRRTGLACVVVLMTGAVSLHAQTSKPSSLVIPSFIPAPPESKRLGILTLVPPDPANGEFVKVVVPIGDLAGRVAHRISNARHDRRERKARQAVEADLRQFLSQQR